MLSLNIQLIKKYFLACFTKHLCDFKNAIFENAIFKIVLIKIAFPNGP